MIALIIIILVSGVGFAYFATQNTAPISVNIFHTMFTDVPLYVVVLAALLLGIVICWVINLFGSVSTFLKIFGKDSKIKKDKEEMEVLNKRIHELQLENEHLKGKTSA